MALTAFQNNFIWVFCTQGDFDVVESARIMGLPASEAMRWFFDPEFQKALGQAQRLRFTLLAVSPYRTLSELAAVAYSNISDLVRVDESGRFVVRAFDDVPDRVLTAVKSVKLKRTTKGGEQNPVFDDVIEIVMHDKIRALTELAQLQHVSELPDVTPKVASDAPRAVAGLLVTPPRPKDELA